jgi:type I restriction enzyme S subunit
MTAQQIITQHLDIWTAAHKTRSSAGRGSNNKLDLVGIKKLRELILELAVRGKLVPQDPSDEPASELLKKIAIEKSKLINEGKIKREQPLGEIEDAEKLFQIPDGWAYVRFGVITYNRDFERVPLSVDERSTRQGEYDYYGASGVIDKINDFTFDKPLMLIGEDGANLINRSTPIAFMAYGKYWVNNHAHVLDGISEEFLTYLCLYINSISLVQYVTGTAQPKMNQAKMNSIPVALPSEKEQHRIVAKVDELMAFCDQLEQTQSDNIAAHAQLVEVLLATLTNSSDHNELQNNWQRIAAHFDTLFTTEHSIDQLKQTILQLAVMGKLVPQNPNDEPASELLKKIAAEKAQLIKEGKIKKEKPLPEITDEEKPFELPRGWAETRFQDITKVITCGMASTPKYHPTGRIFLSAKNVKPYRFIPDDHNFVDEETFRKITQNAFPEKGDILLTRVGAGIGEAAIIDIDIEFAFYVSLTLIKPFLNHLNSKYLLHWLSSPQGITKSLENVYGAGVSQGNLNVNQVRMFDVPIPPLAEQHRIVTKVDELMTLCDTLKTNLQNAQTTQLTLADALVEQAVN